MKYNILKITNLVVDNHWKLYKSTFYINANLESLILLVVVIFVECELHCKCHAISASRVIISTRNFLFLNVRLPITLSAQCCVIFYLQLCTLPLFVQPCQIYSIQDEEKQSYGSIFQSLI